MNLDDPFVSPRAQSSPPKTSNNLFYAYARRTDNYWASRYLLTFENASIASEWWDLVQEEFPDQGVRNGAQLFSFTGDNFLSKPSTNKRFKHLKTKWMYTQIGDATGTSGRNQQIIPLQDENGNVLEGSMKGEGLASVGGFDATALSKNLERMQDLMAQTISQVQKLAEEQAANQALMNDLRALVQENAEHVKAISPSASSSVNSNGKPLAVANADASSISMKEIQSFLDQSSTQIKDLTSANRDLATNLGNILHQAPKRDTQNGASMTVCSHNVRPPPRKLDKLVVGYDYGPGPLNGAPSEQSFSISNKEQSQPSTPKKNKSAKVRFAGVDGHDAAETDDKMDSIKKERPQPVRGKRKSSE